MKHHRTPGLYVESFGKGPELVMLHGWAMHGGVWRAFAERLADRFRVNLVDLPGHGRSGPLPYYAFDAVIAALVRVAPPSAHWLGWSLGALLATGVARTHPGRVRSLMLVAGTPRFTATADWPGVSPELLAQMAANLEVDYAVTLKRFIALQTYGHEQSRTLARQLQAQLDASPRPTQDALRGGLALLQSTDLRSALAAMNQPALAVLGAHDRLAPKALAGALRMLRPALEIRELATAAHLPFLTHAEALAEIILDFHGRHATWPD